jgi:hypothetical protein
LRSLAIRIAHHVGWLAWADKDLLSEYLATTATRLASESTDRLLPPAWLGRRDDVPDRVNRPYADAVLGLLSRRIDVAAALVSSLQRSDPSALAELRSRWVLFPACVNDMPSESGHPSRAFRRLPTLLDRHFRKRFAAMCAQRLLLDLMLDVWASDTAPPVDDCRYGAAIDLVRTLAQAHVTWIRSAVPEALDPISPLDTDPDTAMTGLIWSLREHDDAARQWCESFWSWVHQEHVMAVDRFEAVSQMYRGPRWWMPISVLRSNSHVSFATSLRPQSIECSDPAVRTPRSAAFLTMTADKGEIYVTSETEPLRMPTGVLLDVLSHLTGPERQLVADIARFELWLRCQDHVMLTYSIAGVLSRKAASDGLRERRALRDAFGRTPAATRSVWTRRRSGLRARQSLALGVGLLILLLAFVLAQTPTVRAEELLRRAETFESARPTGRTQHVRQRFTPATQQTPVNDIVIGQDIGDGKVGSRATEAANGLPLRVQQSLDAHHFDWRQPLSAHSFAVWRSTLREPRDQVMTVGADRLALHTSTESGDIREAELIVRRETFQPVHESLVFADGGRIEWQVMEDWVRVETPSSPPLTRRAAPLADGNTLDLAELHARLVLGRTGLDMRGEFRFSRTPDTIRIDGVLAPGVARANVEAPLESVAHVQFTLRSGNGVPAEARGGVSHHTNVHALAHWLDRRIPQASTRESFLGDLIRLLAAVRQRIVVLNDLADRYPDREIGRLSSDARNTLQQLIALHVQPLARDAQDLLERMMVLAGPMPHASPTTQPPSDWQRRAVAAQASMRRLDELTDQLLGQEDVTEAQQHQLSQAVVTLLDALYGRIVR